MAVPKRRKSKSAKGMRRSHDFLTPINLTICPISKKKVPTHTVDRDTLLEYLKSDATGRMPH